MQTAGHQAGASGQAAHQLRGLAGGATRRHCSINSLQ